MPTTNGRRVNDQVREALERERRELVAAVEHLREELGEATDVTRKLSTRLPIAAASAVGAGFVLSGGIGATMRYFARRGREHH
jgi:hypothetical protein